MPVQSAAQAVRGVLQNAFGASELHQEIEFVVACNPVRIVMEVRDRGCGMSADVLARAGEPFFTTKEPGQGMGLGLFLTRNVIERLCGTLELTSNSHGGITAVIELPAKLTSTTHD